jgi:IS5 family transposase
MRPSIHRQLPLVAPPIDHAHCHEVMQMRALLDAQPEIEAMVERDLVAEGVCRDVGRAGMSADQVFRALVVKQMNQFSYEQLAFHLADSVTYRAFCRFGAFDQTPAASTLQDNIRRVSAQTLESINQALLRGPEACRIDSGNKVRVDTTPSRTNVHLPSDSSLLWDAIRVLVTQMYVAWQHVDFVWSDHSQRAKRRTVAIISARKVRRYNLYQDLLDVARRTVGYAQNALQAVKEAGLEQIPAAVKLARFIPLARRVIDQAQRRVINGEKVPPAEKVLSIFEPDTDLIVRGSRDPIYGHKLCLTVGASSLVFDCVIEKGNPTDSTLAVKMINRFKKTFGFAPNQAVFDGAFCSNDNLAKIKQCGVSDVAFTKHQGIELHQMVRSSWVFKRLRRFRAGVEGCISFLKRCFGLARCTWRGGREGFAAFTWSAILSANLLTLARHMLN